MRPKGKNYVDQIREQFIREFNNARKRMEAESKQKPLSVSTTNTGFEINICAN